MRASVLVLSEDGYPDRDVLAQVLLLVNTEVVDREIVIHQTARLNLGGDIVVASNCPADGVKI